jgi:peptidyl-prolyl cis-trans isomerase B (cyclophilin B)
MTIRYALVALALCACSSSSSDGGAPAKTTRLYSSPPAMTIDTSKTYTATIATAKGEFEIALDPKAAPRTVNNFVFLAKDHFYDGLKFHRVEPNFVVQGGDPLGTGGGGPGYTLDDEASPLRHDEGAVAMAKTKEPNSAGSQFYVTLSKQSSLDDRYTVFGKVTRGMDVVKTIAKNDVMTTVTIVERP